MDERAHGDGEAYGRLVATRAAATAALTRDPVTMALALDPGYVVRPHIRLIGEAVRALHLRRFPKVMILTPPQVGKSYTASWWGSFWWLAVRPTDRVIRASYSMALAAQGGLFVRKMIRAHGAEFGLHLDPEHRSIAHFSLLSGGGMMCAGFKGSMTGSRADFVSADDPYKGRAEANSPLIRRNVSDTWSGDINSRLAPGSPTLLTMTPWHPADLSAQLREDEGTVEEGGYWKVIKLPAIATSPHDPLGRRIGDPLPHPRIPDGDRDALLAFWDMKRATTKARDWNSLYQCDPKPEEGALLTAAQLRAARVKVGERPAGPVRSCVAVDPSGGGRDEAGVGAAYLGSDGRCYLTHDRTARMSASEWGRAACELAALTGANTIVVEQNYGRDQASYVVRTSWDALERETRNTDRHALFAGLPPAIVLVNAKKGKVAKAEPVAQQVIEGRVALLGKMPELESEWETWQPGMGISPGRIDWSCYAVYNLLSVPGAGEVVSTPVDVSRSSAAGQVGGGVRIERTGPGT